MENTNDIISYVTACTGPLILMGDDTPVKDIRKGRVELAHGIF
jgi:hypothetical protein